MRFWGAKESTGICEFSLLFETLLLHFTCVNPVLWVNSLPQPEGKSTRRGLTDRGWVLNDPPAFSRMQSCVRDF